LFDVFITIIIIIIRHDDNRPTISNAPRAVVAVINAVPATNFLAWLFGFFGCYLFTKIDIHAIFRNLFRKVMVGSD
jgi:hypothetical protein